mgnify:FL=1|jgi:hypothetical protein
MNDYSKDLENRVLTLESRMDAFDEERIRADERRRVRAQAWEFIKSVIVPFGVALLTLWVGGRFL